VPGALDYSYIQVSLQLLSYQLYTIYGAIIFSSRAGNYNLCVHSCVVLLINWFAQSHNKLNVCMQLLPRRLLNITSGIQEGFLFLSLLCKCTCMVDVFILLPVARALYLLSEKLPPKSAISLMASSAWLLLGLMEALNYLWYAWRSQKTNKFNEYAFARIELIMLLLSSQKPSCSGQAQRCTGQPRNALRSGHFLFYLEVASDALETIHMRQKSNINNSTQ
jgi:hypothetical protein